MTHGNPRPIPRPIPLYLTSTTPAPVAATINPLLIEADLDALSDSEFADFAAWIGLSPESQIKTSFNVGVARVHIDKMRKRLREQNHIRVDGQGLTRTFDSTASAAVRLAYHFGCTDLMVACTGVEEVRDIVFDIEPIERTSRAHGFDGDRIGRALAYLDAPGYFGVNSRRTGENILRLYAGREGGFTLHAVFEPAEGGAFVLVGEADAYGVRTHYASIGEEDVLAACQAFASATNAGVRVSEVGERGLAVWFTWLP